MMKPEDLITPVIYCHCVSTCLCVWSFFFWKKRSSCEVKLDYKRLL